MNSSEIPVMRFEQEGAVECGPASICILFSTYPELANKYSIDDVIRAAGVEDTIATNGTNVRELAKAVENLSKGKFQLLFKRKGSLEDIQKLLDLGFPVTVDWQGSTLDSSVFSGQEGELGHYSTIIGIDRERNSLLMVDSIKDFPNKRMVPVHEFESKWWDTDEIEGQDGSKLVRSENMFFVVIPKENIEKLEKDLGLQTAEQY